MTVKVTMANGGSDSVDFINATGTTLAQVKSVDGGSSNGSLAVFTTSSGTSSEKVRFDKDGNVGIGTTSPSAPLAIGRVNSASEGGQIDLCRSSDNASSWGIDVYGSTSTPSLRFVDNVASATRMAIDGSGNVGIGTSSPAVKLHTTGTTNELARFNASSTGTGYVLITQNNSTGEGLKLAYTNSDGSSAIGSVYSGVLKFLTGDTERARIDSSGNLLVGTTTATHSGVASRCILKSANDVLGVVTDSGNTQAVRFTNGTTAVGSINLTTSATSYSTSSDYRLKENVQPMTGALNTVSALKPCTYSWKVDGTDGQGFIAHELQAVVPDCVSGEKDAVDAEGNPVHQGIDTSFLVATLTAAIQELKAIVDTQAARIEALENPQ